MEVDLIFIDFHVVAKGEGELIEFWFGDGVFFEFF